MHHGSGPSASTLCGEDIEGESRETLSAREKEVLGMNVGIHIDAFKYPRWH